MCYSGSIERSTEKLDHCTDYLSASVLVFRQRKATVDENYLASYKKVPGSLQLLNFLLKFQADIFGGGRNTNHNERNFKGAGYQMEILKREDNDEFNRPLWNSEGDMDGKAAWVK